MPEETKTNWLGVAAGLAAAIQWLLFCWRPGDLWIYTPSIAVVAIAIANWFSSANYLRRLASGLFAAGVGIGSLPSFGLNFRWKDLGFLEVIPMEGTATLAIVCIAAGLICVALEFSERVKAMGITFVATAMVISSGVVIATKSGSGQNAVGSNSASNGPEVTVQNSTGTFLNSHVEGDVDIYVGSPQPAKMDAANSERPSYADVASLLEEFRLGQSWTYEMLNAELTAPSSIDAKDVTLGVDNLTANALRITLIDCTTCFDESGIPKTTSSPLENTIIVGNEVCPTLYSFRASPKLEGMMHSIQVPSKDLATFHNPSGWFAVFADSPRPDGKPQIVPLGIFKILAGPEPVLELRSMEDVGDGRNIKAELVE